MTIGHWLHAAPYAKELNLPGASEQAEILRNWLAGHRADIERAMRQAANPFELSVQTTANGLQVEGDAVAIVIATRFFDRLCAEKWQPGEMSRSLEPVMVDAVMDALKLDLALALNGLSKVFTLESISQVAFLQMLLVDPGQLLFALGPTGTGKTYLAIAAGLNFLAEGRVNRVILTHPHVYEPGEVVTPASRKEMDPDSQLDYFDDILFELIGQDKTTELKRSRKLEILPFGRLRSRVLDDTFVVLDEAQNATIAKMRMAVTRIGKRTQMVLTGDPSHCEVLGDEPSGLLDLLDLVEGTELARVHTFDSASIVRNDLAARLEGLYADRQKKSPVNLAA